MSDRQFSYYTFRLYCTFGGSLAVAVLSSVNLNVIVHNMKDFIKSGQTQKEFENSTQINIKNLEREFITFFALAAFSLAIFVLVGSQIFRVEEGEVYQNLYNRFTFLLLIILLIGILCYSISIYKNVSNLVVDAPITLINVITLIILFLILGFSFYKFFRSTELAEIRQTSSYASKPTKPESGFFDFLGFGGGQTQRQKAERQARQLDQELQLQTLRSRNKDSKQRIKLLKQRNSGSTVSSLKNFSNMTKSTSRFKGDTPKTDSDTISALTPDQSN